MKAEDFQRKFKIRCSFESMTLSEAVRIVIEQNKSLGCIPTRFMTMTQMGNAVDLREVIIHLVMKRELLETLENAIERYGNLVAIEDLIAYKNDGFNLPEEVVGEARARSQWFDQLRQGHKIKITH